MKCEKSGNHTISYQSLLLSTTVLNDYCDILILKILDNHMNVGLRSSDLRNLYR